MASEDRSSSDALKLDALLEEKPYGFDFFQLLRRFECLHKDRPRIGEADNLSDEYFRLGQDASLAFAPSTISSYTRGSNGRPARLGVYFLGLFGPNGPLPLHLTEFARSRSRNFNDPTFERFADVFHHRILSLFYRAWSQAQPAASFDRPEFDRFGEYLASLFGLGMPAFKERDAAPDLAKLYYTGHFSLQTKTASGLEDLLADYFEVPVAIEEFQGSWIEIPESEWVRLGESEATGTLGVSAIIGSRVWDQQLKFRVVCGPMGFEDYERLLPSSPSLSRMAALIRTYIGDELIWDLQLILIRKGIPEIQLGSAGRLGWTTWLTGESPTEDAGDFVIESEQIPVRVPAAPQPLDVM